MKMYYMILKQVGHMNVSFLYVKFLLIECHHALSLFDLSQPLQKEYVAYKTNIEEIRKLCRNLDTITRDATLPLTMATRRSSLSIMPRDRSSYYQRTTSSLPKGSPRRHTSFIYEGRQGSCIAMDRQHSYHMPCVI